MKEIKFLSRYRMRHLLLCRRLVSETLIPKKLIPYIWEYWAVLTQSESVLGEENLPCSHIDAAADGVARTILTTIPRT